MNIGQELYLEYIQRRLKREKTKRESPPIPYEMFKTMWNDRVNNIEENNTDVVNALNTLLEIDNDEDLRNFARITPEVQPTEEWGEYDF